VPIPPRWKRKQHITTNFFIPPGVRFTIKGTILEELCFFKPNIPPHIGTSLSKSKLLHNN
jgi:hypothetical protein